jgi:hypothetical protein
MQHVGDYQDQLGRCLGAHDKHQEATGEEVALHVRAGSRLVVAGHDTRIMMQTDLRQGRRKGLSKPFCPICQIRPFPSRSAQAGKRAAPGRGNMSI